MQWMRVSLSRFPLVDRFLVQFLFTRFQLRLSFLSPRNRRRIGCGQLQAFLCLSSNLPVAMDLLSWNLCLGTSFSYSVEREEDFQLTAKFVSLLNGFPAANNVTSATRLLQGNGFCLQNTLA